MLLTSIIAFCAFGVLSAYADDTGRTGLSVQLPSVTTQGTALGKTLPSTASSQFLPLSYGNFSIGAYEDYGLFDNYMKYPQPSPIPSPTASPTQTASASQPSGLTLPAAASAGLTSTPIAPIASPQPATLTDSKAEPSAAPQRKGMKEAQIKARMIELIKNDAAAVNTEQVGSVGSAADGAATVSAANATEAAASAEATPAPSETTGAGADTAATEGADTQPGTVIVLINVTNPKANESDLNAPTVEIVYKSTYSICGVRDDEADPEEPIILYLTRYNETADSYTEIADIDGETRWVVGSNGVFTRSVMLEEGENRFAIAACKSSVIKAAVSEGRPIGADEVQVEKFTITYRSQNVAEKISEVLKELTIANILKEIDNS